MVSLNLPLTKKSDAAAAPAPLWHPNFRNYERLPDTKAVRTTFFVNATTVAIAASLLIWTGYREYRLHDLTQQIAQTEQEINSNRKQNAEFLRLSKVFADEEKKLNEAASFVRQPIPATEFVSLLAQTLPKEIQIEFVDMRVGDAAGSASQCLLRGIVAGTKDQASGTAAGYVDTLRTTPRFATAFESVSLTTLNTDTRTGLLNFEIVMKFKAPAKEKKP